MRHKISNLSTGPARLLEWDYQVGWSRHNVVPRFERIRMAVFTQQCTADHMTRPEEKMAVNTPSSDVVERVDRRGGLLSSLHLSSFASCFPICWSAPPWRSRSWPRKTSLSAATAQRRASAIVTWVKDIKTIESQKRSRGHAAWKMKNPEVEAS